MKLNLLVLAVMIVAVLFFTPHNAGAQCPEDPNDLGICDTLYVETFDCDHFYEAEPGSFDSVRVAIYVTHDSNTFWSEPDQKWVQDSIRAFVVPLTFWHQPPGCADSVILPNWDNWNNTTIIPGDPLMSRSMFRHIADGHTGDTVYNRMLRMVEAGKPAWYPILDIESHSCDADSGHMWLALLPIEPNNQAWWEGERELLATMTFHVYMSENCDTTEIGIDSTLWPPINHLTFTRYDMVNYIPRHLLPVKDTIIPPEAECEWVSFDGSPPGTPAEIQVIFSDVDQTELEVVTHGMYVCPEVVEGETFQRIYLPQLDGEDTVYATTQDTGKCELPVMNRLLGLVTDAPSVTMDIDLLEYEYYYDYHIYPYQSLVPEEDTGVFYMDTSFYQSYDFYPFDPWDPPPVEFWPGWFHHLWAVAFATNLIYARPADSEILVAKRMRVTLNHSGSPAGYDTLNITRLYDKMYEGSVLNWGFVKPYFLPYLPWRKAKYLIIYADQYANPIKPLETWKKLKGLKVTSVKVSTIGNTYNQIKQYITNFYNGCKCSDVYVLLVGDYNQVATGTYNHPDFGNQDSDYKYACVKGNDPYPEVFVGRLSPDDESNLTVIVNKIINREKAIPGGNWYTKVLLAAHKQNYPLKYTQCKEQIRTRNYSWKNPTFNTCYGGAPTNNNNTCVTNSINDGRNIVNYRGHGSTTTWSGWASGGGDWTIANVSALGNDGKTPIVYSISCNNNDISVNDCIGEEWLQVANKGAVAHYGASCPSFTTPNHDLDKYLFKATYDNKIQILGPVVKWAQEKTILLYGGKNTPATSAEKNAWIYLLLGDPEMYIRTSTKWFWPYIPYPYIFGRESFSGTVLDSLGDPVKDALVTIYDDSTDSNACWFADDNGDFEVSFSTNPESDSVIVCITEPEFEPYQTKVLRLIRGDANGDKIINAGDVIYLINYLFLGTSPPTPITEVGDCNCDEIVDTGDVIFLINYLFLGTSEPYCP